MSTLRRAPRVAFRGGGELNPAATSSLTEAPETLDEVVRGPLPRAGVERDTIGSAALSG